MYHYVAQNCSAPRGKFLERIFEFSHLLIRELIEGLSLNYAIFSTSSIDMYYYVVHKGSAPRGNF